MTLKKCCACEVHQVKNNIQLLVILTNNKSKCKSFCLFLMVNFFTGHHDIVYKLCQEYRNRYIVSRKSTILEQKKNNYYIAKI